jgi:predicted adenine nucleotide alpha hydrolase (AANH) superfamily ATPase
MSKSRILAHICCAPDAIYVIDLLQNEHLVTGYFYNPNIGPEEEYAKRLQETRKVEKILGFELLEEIYDPERWLKATKKFKDEPEKGKRCDICYALRLERTAQKASALGIPSFTTIMSLSPWKKADVLNRIGRMLGRRYRIHFLEADFKKKGGFEKSIGLSRRHELYRQDYCGCLYSRRNKTTAQTK